MAAAVMLGACSPSSPPDRTQQPTDLLTTEEPTEPRTQAPTETPATPTLEATVEPTLPPVSPTVDATTAPTEPTTANDALAFRQEMRRLWVDQLTWTRVFIISSLANLPEAEAAAERLLQNQTDIGESVRPFLGDDAADQMSFLLDAFSTIAVDLVAAANSGDTAAFDAAVALWRENADAIAALLSGISSETWPLADMQTMFITHVELTLDQINARMDEDWAADIAAFDAAHDNILALADTVSAGIIQQFPDRFAASEASEAEVELALAMDDLWMQHVMWTRFYIISVTSQLPDAEATAERLFANQTDIGNAFKPYYGDEAGTELTGLLEEHIEYVAALLEAAVSGDSAAVEAARVEAGENAAAIAAFLNTANPDNWPADEMEAMMNAHIDATIEEATARINEDWAADAAAYDAVEDQILEMSAMLTDGIVAQFPDQFN